MSVASSRPPDTARLPHLQQLAHRADRRLLIGSAVLALAGLALALRGPQVQAAALAAVAVLPAAWLGGAQAGRAIAFRCGWPVASVRSPCWHRYRAVPRCGRRCCRPACSRA